MSPAYRRYFIPNSIAFLTVATEGRKPVFRDAAIIETALETLRNVKEMHPFRMRGYVVLPDHWHLLIWTGDGHFEKIAHAFKRNVTFELRKHHGAFGTIWQKRYYDHIIRDDDDFRNHLDYIHYNPVRHGHAGRSADYRFSSFHHYAGRGWYGPDWGRVVPENIDGMNAGGDLAPGGSASGEEFVG